MTDGFPIPCPHLNDPVTVVARGWSEITLKSLHGDQYDFSPHHAESTVLVHGFRPVWEGEQWYVKAYLLGEDPDGTDAAVFIRIHTNGKIYRSRRR
jgi:hypothetical protein